MIKKYIEKQLKRLAEQFSEPARPIMSQEEFEALPKFKKNILTCNVIGCKRMVSTHGMLCVEHHTGQDAEQSPKKGEEHLPRKYIRLSCECNKPT